MALVTQPNGSSVVPLAGAPRIPVAPINVTAQTESTLIVNANGGLDSVTVKVISS